MAAAAQALLIAPLLLPFAVAGGMAAAGGLWLGGRWRARLLAPAQTLGFVAADAALLGPPAWPPQLAREEAAWVALLGLLLGILLPLLPRWADGLQLAVLAWPLAIALWLATRAPLDLPTALIATALALFGAAVVGPLAGARQRSPRRALMLLVALLGLAAIAALDRAPTLGAPGAAPMSGVLGRAPTAAQLALALAASLAGVLVAARSLGVANAVLIGPTGTALSLAGALAFSNAASRPALLLLALVFAADRIARRLAPRRHLWLDGLLFAAACLIPLGLALALLRLTSGPLHPP